MVYCDRGAKMKYNAYEIGLRAYNARHNKNMNQAEISEALGIGQSSYSRFETGQGELPLSKIIELCDYLGITVSWLVGENNIPQLTDNERLELENYKNYLISKRTKKIPQ
jgi:transcriptional regulator with XRE-family HTH domain